MKSSVKCSFKMKAEVHNSAQASVRSTPLERLTEKFVAITIHSLLYASGSLNLNILHHIPLAELCLQELTIKIETIICHILATFMAV